MQGCQQSCHLPWLSQFSCCSAVQLCRQATGPGHLEFISIFLRSVYKGEGQKLGAWGCQDAWRSLLETPGSCRCFASQQGCSPWQPRASRDSRRKSHSPFTSLLWRPLSQTSFFWDILSLYFSSWLFIQIQLFLAILFFYFRVLMQNNHNCFKTPASFLILFPPQWRAYCSTLEFLNFTLNMQVFAMLF